MAITITSGPSVSQPIPVSDCLILSILPDNEDVFVIEGTFASLTVDFTNSTPPVSPISFTLWGQQLSGNANLPTNFTGTSFKYVSSDFSTAINFLSMIRANLFFSLYTTSTILPNNPNRVVITWKQCGVQGKFAGSEMSFTSLTSTGAAIVVVNGVSPEFVEGYQLLVRVQRLVGNNIVQVSELEGLDARPSCNTLSNTVIDFMPTIKPLLFTPMPDLNLTHPGEQSSIMQAFYIDYGWLYRVNCEPVSGDILQYGPFYVINSAVPAFSVSGITPYYNNNTGRFLTTQPLRHELAEDSYAWLWFINKLDYTGPLRLFIQLRTRVGASLSDSSVILANSTGPYVYALNSSPAYVASVFGISVSEIDFYLITVQYQKVPPNYSSLTSSQSFRVLPFCDNDEMYFLTTAGGIATLVCENLQTIDLEQVGTETYLQNECSTDRVFKNKYGGRSLTGVRAKRRHTYRLRLSNSLTQAEMVADLKASPQRYVRMRGNDNNFYAAKFILEPGSITVYRYGEAVEIELSGYLANDIPVQYSAEPNN